MARYITPEHAYSNSFLHDILSSNHVLIAGKTGSGKSVLINSLLHEIMGYYLPILGDDTENPGRQCNIILLDPKQVELSMYARLPHCLAHADTADGAIEALEMAEREMDRRYSVLKARSAKKWQGQSIFIFVDEFADFTGNKRISALVDRIARLGRAANIHLIIATQRPSITDRAISAATRANLDTRIALRTAESKDSRMIIGITGAELLPMFGKCIYDSPSLIKPEIQTVPFHEDDELEELVKYWEAQGGRNSSPTKPVFISTFLTRLLLGY